MDEKNPKQTDFKKVRIADNIAMDFVLYPVYRETIMQMEDRILALESRIGKASNKFRNLQNKINEIEPSVKWMMARFEALRRNIEKAQNREEE